MFLFQKGKSPFEQKVCETDRDKQAMEQVNSIKN